MRDKAVDIGNADEVDINLFQLMRDVWEELRRRALIILAVIAIAGVAFYMAAVFRYSPVYEASTVFTANKASAASYSSGNAKNSAANRIGVVFPYILNSDALKSLVMDDLGYESQEEFPATINSTVIQGTNLITLNVKSDDPQAAYDVLQSVLRNCSYISELAYGELRFNIISDSGVPEKPSNSAGAAKAAVIGILFAFLVSLIYLAIKCAFGKTVKTSEDISRFLGAEDLGNIPYMKAAKRGAITIDTEDAPVTLIESIRMIRHRIEREAEENKVKTILITSAVRSEGKTTAAANLAIALANHRNKVLLVDGNLRNPSVLTALGMTQAGKGIPDLLSGDCELKDVTVSYNNNDKLSVIPGGNYEGVPAELWSSPAAEQLFGELREQYDYILIDAPQSVVISDTGLLARFSDGYIYVVQQNYADVSTLREGTGKLASVGCDLLGCIINEKDRS